MNSKPKSSVASADWSIRGPLVAVLLFGWACSTACAAPPPKRSKADTPPITPLARPASPGQQASPPDVLADGNSLPAPSEPKNDRPEPSIALPLTFHFSPTLAEKADEEQPAEIPPEETLSPEDRPGLFKAMPEPGDKFWYLDFGLRTGHTRLESTNDQINKRIELPLKLDFLNLFNSPHTPLDRKTDGLLMTGYAGIGRRETDWLTWNFYLGGGAGGDRNHQRRLNANFNANFDYAYYFTGLTTDIYPWGLPEYRDFEGWVDRFRSSRPYVLTGLEFGYVRAKGWGNFKLAPLTLYADEVKVRDFLVSYLLGLGWELPINQRWSFNWSGHYAFHFYRPEEYNSWNLVFAFRYRF